jgi:hypothetical protein
MNTFHINELSEQLLLQVKLQKDTTKIRLNLEALSIKTLSDNLTNDDKKKAFWINIYNAYYQILRKEKNIVKPDIYQKKLFKIAGNSFSLDDVEHGILRKYRYKYSLGFFANLFTKKLIKKLAVNEIDYRIHFSLNCGAESCPPIAFYNAPKIDFQLDMATQSFLEGETEFDDENRIVNITQLFKWIFADFGGTKGIKIIFKQQLNKDISNYTIKYKAYSWEDDLANFV